MKELRAEHGAKVAIAHEAVEGKRGHLAVRVFSSDAEQGGGGEVDRVVRAIEAGLPQVTELTKRDFYDEHQSLSGLPLGSMGQPPKAGLYFIEERPLVIYPYVSASSENKL